MVDRARLVVEVVAAHGLQWRDLLAWDAADARTRTRYVEGGALRRYLPMDLLQVTEMATTRAKAPSRGAADL